MFLFFLWIAQRQGLFLISFSFPFLFLFFSFSFPFLFLFFYYILSLFFSFSFFFLFPFPFLIFLFFSHFNCRVQKPILCVGCGNSHKYYDSKTHQPLCSLRCYQIHHQQHPLPSNGFNTLQPSPSPSPSPSLSSFQMYPQQVIAHEQGLQSSVFSPQEQLPSQGLETFA